MEHRMSNRYSILLYDAEILRPPPGKPGTEEPDIEYCDGWKDYGGMDLTVVTAYSYLDHFPRIFLKDNLLDFLKLVAQHEILAGFNNIAFDNPLLNFLMGMDFTEERSYDIPVEIRAAAGANQWKKGYNLDNTCKVNLGVGKSGAGALAPVLWQRGRHGEVIDYGLRDTWLTKGILDMILAGTPLIDPGSPSDRIFVKSPV